jgi:hypothetical protein
MQSARCKMQSAGGGQVRPRADAEGMGSGVVQAATFEMGGKEFDGASE